MGPDATVAFGTGAREFTLEMLEHHLASHPVQSAGLEALFASLEGNRTAFAKSGALTSQRLVFPVVGLCLQERS